MLREWGARAMWGRDRRRMALVLGVPFGVAMALLALTSSHSPAQALVVGAVCAVSFGGASALYMWRSWPAARGLAPSDRVAVVLAVQRGERPDDPRLAPAVVELAAAQRRAAARDRRHLWLPLVLTAVTAGWAVNEALDGRRAAALSLGALGVLYLAILAALPATSRRRAARADRAVSRTTGWPAEQEPERPGDDPDPG